VSLTSSGHGIGIISVSYRLFVSQIVQGETTGGSTVGSRVSENSRSNAKAQGHVSDLLH
jgi:hypothetical protein